MTNVIRPRFHPWLERNAYRRNPPGSILFHAGSGVFQRPGGGEVQLIKTAEALEEKGLPIGLFNPWSDRFSDHRIIHFFGLHAEAEELARQAKMSGIGVVISPICWYDPIAQWKEAPGWIPGLTGITKWFLLRNVRFSRRLAWRSRLLSLADRILPNSEAEADQLVGLLGVDRSRIEIVPNAVDTIAKNVSDQPAVRQFGSQPFVLYVGRIEPRKNVLGLIHASISCNYPLVIIGQSPIESADYEKKCREAAMSHNVIFAGALPKNDPLLLSAMLAAKVFALPSWFETPGLAALEAASLGTPVVITSRGATREYFGDSVWYCDPAHHDSVSHALNSAWNRQDGRHTELAHLIQTKYTWSEVARIMEGIYDAVTP